MHVGVFADLEGSFGIWRMRQCRGGTAEWQYGRACLTEDINQVVAGAYAGGATKVTIKDTHETGFNCLINKLDKRARYVGGHFTTPTFFGDISDLDLVLYVAIHAGSGTEGAFFPHTHYGVFSKFYINEKEICEMDLYGAYLGEFGIPIGFVSGESIAVEQAKRNLPWVKSVVVDKKQETYTSPESSFQYLEEGRNQLKMVAKKAVQEKESMESLVMKGPLQFKAVFRNQQLADHFNTWGFDQDGESVSWHADTMIKGFDMLNKLTFFPRKIYRYRRPLLFFKRQMYQIKASYFAPKPNSEGAIVTIGNSL